MDLNIHYIGSDMKNVRHFFLIKFHNLQIKYEIDIVLNLIFLKNQKYT